MRVRRFTVFASVGPLVAGLLFGLPPVPVLAAVGPSSEPSVPVSPVRPQRTAGTVLPPAVAQMPVWPTAGTALADLAAGKATWATSLLSSDSVLASQARPGGLPVTVARRAGRAVSAEENEQRMMRGLPELLDASAAGPSSVTVTTLDQARDCPKFC